MSSLPLPKFVSRINDPNKIVLTKGLLKDKIEIWVSKMVKATKEISASQWAAPILLAVLLGYNVYSTRQQTNAIDQLKTDLTILKTQKEDAEKYIDKENLRITQERFQIDRENMAWRENIFKELAALKLAIRDKSNNKGEN